MPHAPCPVPHAPCPVPHVPCPMPHAPKVQNTSRIIKFLAPFLSCLICETRHEFDPSFLRSFDPSFLFVPSSLFASSRQKMKLPCWFLYWVLFIIILGKEQYNNNNSILFTLDCQGTTVATVSHIRMHGFSWKSSSGCCRRSSRRWSGTTVAPTRRAKYQAGVGRTYTVRVP